LKVSAQHGVGFVNQALGLIDVFPKFCLACLNLGSLLRSTFSPLFTI